MSQDSQSFLRSHLNAPLRLDQAIAVVVPLCVEIASIHEQGYGCFLHPSNIVLHEDNSWGLDAERAAMAPTDPKDLACLAPGIGGEHLGDASSSVYSIGAIFYELLTARSVADGMAAPTQLIPNLPASVDALLSKALIKDADHRPDDLRALALAFHQLAPHSVAPPPDADLSHLDHRPSGFDIDVSLSMLPPAPAPRAPEVVAVNHTGMAATLDLRSGDSSTNMLSALKSRLEADRRARYVVVKDGMDHGPFTAVELLQQIGSNSFTEDELLRDDIIGETRPVCDWPDFAPFAEHARRHRDIKAEKVALAVSVAKEKKGRTGSAMIGILAVGGVLALAGVWFLTQSGSRNDKVELTGEVASNVEAEGSVTEQKGGKRGGGSGKRVVGSQGGFPVLSGGLSCESAMNAYNEEMSMGNKGKADLTQGQFASVMNSGSYFSHCGVPNSMGISICAAVQNGRAVGVTVVTTPSSPSHQSCIASGVRRLSFPSNPKLDVVRTKF